MLSMCMRGVVWNVLRRGFLVLMFFGLCIKQQCNESASATAGGRLAGQVVRAMVHWAGVSLPVSLTSYSVVNNALLFVILLSLCSYIS